MLFSPGSDCVERQMRRVLALLVVSSAAATVLMTGAMAEDECALIWSTYVGGSDVDYGSRVAVGASGDVYVTGATESADFPVAGAYDATYSGGISDAYVMKLASDGALQWATYLGGGGEDHGYGMTVDALGNVYVVGYTDSTDFPAAGGYDATHNGGVDAFVAVFSGGGALVWATYFGGSDEDRAYGIAAGDLGDIYLAGYTNSNDFPAIGSYHYTHNGEYDAFVAKFSPEGDVFWSTYLGGSSADRCFGMAAGAAGDVCITGRTASEDFPTTEGAYDRNRNGGNDVFVADFSDEGALMWATYFGGSSDDEGSSIAAVSADGIYVTGKTSSPDLPATTGVHDGTHEGPWDAFLSKFGAGGSLLWSTFLGGSGVDGGQAVTADGVASIYVTGYTESTDFPTPGGFDTSYNGGVRDVFVSKFNGGGTLFWSTYLGGSGSEEGIGIAAAGAHHIYVAGMTESDDFPVWGGLEAEYHDGAEAFVTKLGNPAAGTVPALATITLIGLSLLLAVTAAGVSRSPDPAREATGERCSIGSHT